MSNSCWVEQISKRLTALTTSDGPARVALLGIGNELNGDDGAGVAVARALRARLGSRPHLLLIEAGPAPESFTGPVRRFNPAIVLLVDAAAMDSAPGTVALLSWDEIDGLSASTHTLPPSVLSRYLMETLGCPVLLLAIQAGQVEFDQPISPVVQQAVDEVVEGLARVL